MIPHKIYPNMTIFSNINASMPIDDFSLKGFGPSNLKATEGANFKDVLSGCCFKKKFNQINDEPEIDMKDNQ